MTISPREAQRAAALTDEALLAECEERFFVAGGPGGQHRNKTETAVRLLHRPTGLVVTAPERRSQLQNRGEALERLRRVLQKLSHVPRRRVATRPTKGSTRRRLEAKRHQSEKKQGRRDGW
jgi:protein subunit release factor B